MPTSAVRDSPVWLRRTRVIAGAVLVGVMLQFSVGGRVLPPGLDRAPVLAANGPLAALLLILVVFVGGVAGGVVGGSDRKLTGLFVAMLGLSGWAAQGGTVDSWLRQTLTRPDESGTRAYVQLILDYIYLLLCVGGIFAANGVVGGAARVATLAELKRALGEWKQGIPALAVTSAIGALAILVLTGPRVAQTHRGQVYFAVGVGFALAVLAATKLMPPRHAMWYLMAPFVVGLVGLAWAIVDPSLPGAYRRLNNLPAQGLVRALPIEMVAVGCAGVLFTIRRLSSARSSREAESAS